MEMFWSTNGELQLWVYLKENQPLKCLNRGSMHTEACFQVIPSGVLRQLAVLTMRMEETESMRMDILYPSHAKALKVAKLAPEVFPTLGKVLDNIALQHHRDSVQE